MQYFQHNKLMFIPKSYLIEKLHYDQQIIDVFGNYWMDSLKKN
jgi:hypothetical protein